MIARIVRTTLAACAVLSAPILSGCSANSARSAVSLSVWQNQMQTYVVNQGNGDMNVLRDVKIEPGQPGFRSFSSDRPENSKDVAGALVGLQPFGDQLWYVYVVAEIDKEQLTSMRLAAVSQNGPQFTWRVGNDEAGGEKAYIAHREQVWRAQHPGEGNPPRRAYNFPNADDDFTMQATGGNIAVRESASGAMWTLSLAETQAGGVKK